ncbi:MAG: hypothetical protein J5964_07980 [Eubacterium sp.]|nr:hypothetical protein [Eubacterium sp.]
MKNKYYQYFVEGEDEKKLLNTLKNQLRVIQPGKVQKLNVVESKISTNIIRTLKQGTIVILVFDTDTNNTDILNWNIKKLNDSHVISKVITVPQVKNLEDELLRSCNIKDIKDLLNSRSKKEYKSDLIRVTNLDAKLIEHSFDISLFWNKQPGIPYQHIINGSAEIKI